MSGKKISSSRDARVRKEFTYYLLKDIEALDYMLKNEYFKDNQIRIGAEQELAIVDQKMRATCQSLKVLGVVENDNFTTELSQFNLEINLEPIQLQSGVFKKLHQDLKSNLKFLKDKTANLNLDFPLTGILPTLERADFDIKNMTPFQRYHVLNDILKKVETDTFDIRISGVDELQLSLDSILAESGNTSFQIHLQLKSGEFKEMYNWAQMISGPVLAACTNSPLLLGRELWSETRIALFQQTVDSRNSLYLLREQRPRVTFGNDWVHNCVSEIFKDDVSHYPLLITAEVNEDAMQKINEGIPPKLKALNMHNGNIYKWNRLCYGLTDGKPHLRIENRYIPAGPTLIDEVANVAFWVGLLKAMPEKYKNLPDLMSFKAARQNFYKAAKHGLFTQFDWFGKKVSARQLLLTELFPLAEQGLKKCGIKQDEIDLYLEVIKQRVKKSKTGSIWTSTNYNRLKKQFTKKRTAYFLTKEMLKYQEKDIPVHFWRNININRKPCELDDFIVADVMTTEIVLVHEEDPILILKHLKEWNKAKQILVENDQHKLIGIVDLQGQKLPTSKEGLSTSVSEIMQNNIRQVDPEMSLLEAKGILSNEDLSIVSVVSDKKLVGILTTEHFNQFSLNA